MSKVVSDLQHEIYIVTTYLDGKKAGFVCTWIVPGSLSTAKPKIVLVVSKFNDSLTLIEKSRRLTVNLLSRDQLQEFFVFGTKSSLNYDKFLGIAHDTSPYGIILKNSAGYLDCVVEDIFETPDRKILYCSVEREEKLPYDSILLSEALGLLPEEQRAELERQMELHTKRDDELNL